MLRHERRLLIDCLGMGLALALLVIAIDVSGALTPAENYLYDLRALHCQFFAKPPTDKLVHLDIDDKAIEVIGRFPWPRSKLAQIIDEVGRAGPKAIELDILLSEAQPLEYVPLGSPTTNATSQPATSPSAANDPATTKPVACLPIDNDAELASEMRKLGNVIVPATFEPRLRESTRYGAMVEALGKDLEQDESIVTQRVKASGFTVGPEGLGDSYFQARRDAIAQRLAALSPNWNSPFNAIRGQLLPHTPLDVESGLVNVLREELDHYRAAAAFQRFAVPRPPGVGTYANMHIQLAPLRQISDAASAGAYSNYMKFGSPVIRTIPLLLEQNGSVYCQMGLAIACKMLDADTAHMRIERGRLMIPIPGKPDLAIPLAPARENTDGFLIGNLIDIPWIGSRDWETMYDPKHKLNAAHVPMTEVWNACYTRQKLIRNNSQMDDAILSIYSATKDPSRFEKYKTSIPEAEDFSVREKAARQLIEDWKPFLPTYEAMKPQEMQEDDKIFLASYRALAQLLELTPSLKNELAGYRAGLSSKMKEKAVIVGWTATGAIADFVPTSLHEKCPGAVVHGVVYNGIMTGELWTRLPWWTAEALSFLLAMLTALAVGYLTPYRALMVAAGLFIGYALINGELLFDYGNWIVGAAGPLTAIGLVWGGCTLTRVTVEATERKRITRRFSTYADSKLVDYILETGQDSFEGEMREISVVFTDFANFTALSERLGTAIVPVLNELLGELVPLIGKTHLGYVNKFLGDGIMFFYGAPYIQHDHAKRAVSTILAMQTKLGEFNLRLRARNLPELSMRGGIASDKVVVGDAGYVDRSDYTCLGDGVNLASRLEGANKVTGTHTLINDRAAELLEGEFVIRPIGKIQAVGKELAVMCYEPLAKTAEASDRDRELAALTKEMVDAFIDRRFTHVIEFANQLDTAFGQSKLAKLYHSMAQSCIDQPPGDDFDGRIVLTAK